MTFTGAPLRRGGAAVALFLAWAASGCGNSSTKPIPIVPVTWKQQSPAAKDTLRALVGVYAAASTDVFAVGQGTLLHYDGAFWTKQASPTPLDWGAVSGTSGSDVWAVGNRGAIIHYDGTRWGLRSSPTGIDLRAVFAVSPTEAYAAGKAGEVLRYNGVLWMAQPSPTLY